MRRITLACFLSIIWMTTAVTGSPVPAWAGATPAVDAGKYPILAQSEVAVLKGDLWTTASRDSKVAFVWGICSIIEAERIAMEMIPDIKVRNISAVAADGLKNVSLNDIVRAVDGYYESNPANIDVPVLRVIWDTMIIPKVQTGVAGRPLKK